MNENTLELVCKECGKVYDSNNISEIAKFWGIIVYEGEEHNLIGLTCIDCTTTTIQKIKVEDTKDWITELRGIRRERIYGFKYILPFSYEIIANSGIENLPEFVSKEKGERFHLPAEFKLLPIYFDKRIPDFFKNVVANSIWESDVHDLEDFENVHRLKVLPRLSWNKSIYYFYDRFLYETNDKSTPMDYKIYMGKLFHRRLFLYFPWTNGRPENWSKKEDLEYNDMLKNTGTNELLYLPKISNNNAITFEEYEEIESNIRVNNKTVAKYMEDEKLDCFRIDYLKIRNRLDFEKVYRDEFFYPYIRKLYYDPGWLERETEAHTHELDMDIEETIIHSLDKERSVYSQKSLKSTGLVLNDQKIEENTSQSAPQSESAAVPPSSDDDEKGQKKKRKKSGKRGRKAKGKNFEEFILAPKPIKVKRLGKVEKKQEYLKLLEDVNELEKKYPSLKNIKALSIPMLKLKKRIVKKAKKDNDIFIDGEQGTGKSLIAEAIYEISGRKGNFITIGSNTLGNDVNTATSKLFGHEKGAFTGASSSRIGAFKEADGGTLFFDEIGIIALEVQYLILKAVDEKKFQPLGSDKIEKADVKIVYATNKNMVLEVKEERFRGDLWDRIRACRLKLPSLSERIQDIFLITEHFLRKTDNFDKLKDARNEIFSYIKHKMIPPGNVRDIKNSVENWDPEDSESSLKEYFEEGVPSDGIIRQLKMYEKSPNAKIFDEEVLYWWFKLKVCGGKSNWKDLTSKKLCVARKTISRAWNKLRDGIAEPKS